MLILSSSIFYAASIGLALSELVYIEVPGPNAPAKIFAADFTIQIGIQ
jgi:hypothetical protein